MRIALAVIPILLGTALPTADDPCAALVSSSLKARLEKAFPELRVPRVSDNLPEDVEYNRVHGGNVCLGVASGDFDGDGIRDTLIGLTARKGGGGRVVVAMARGSRWDLRTLTVWPDGRSRLFVEVDAPGTYKRTEALDGPLETGERNPLTCRHAVAVFGAAESSAVAYCLNGSRWEHVWISD